jgi:hypothetical protein
MAGLGLAEVCKALRIDTAVPMLWEEQHGKDSVYAHCINAIRRKQALLLEDSMWESAVTDGRSCRDAMRISLLRSRMPEYKDNAPNIIVPVQVKFSINNEPYVVDNGEYLEENKDEQQG